MDINSPLGQRTLLAENLALAKFIGKCKGRKFIGTDKNSYARVDGFLYYEHLEAVIEVKNHRIRLDECMKDRDGYVSITFDKLLRISEICKLLKIPGYVVHGFSCNNVGVTQLFNADGELIQDIKTARYPSNISINNHKKVLKTFARYKVGEIV